ncbi:MAG TPA: DUF5916 domain-containing protein [Thermoanaerobaculia bacterium]|jgi:hypothetical protein|nr:DUF5916 domain-containing protein [Thermoanaerobaculia bacterium]
MARSAIVCLLLSLGCLLAVPHPGAAARQLEIHRATSAIHVDGVLDEAAWKDALTIDLPYEWSPDDNVPPPVRTDFLVTYDDKYLYAAFRAYDPEPSQIRAHLMDRDAIATFIQDDHVFFMIDPFNDSRRGFQFRVNPLGVQADALFSQNEGIEDFSFDMIWASAARITAEGYVVEIAVPLSQIRFPRTAGPQTWGFDIGRSYPRSVRHRISSGRRERDNPCVLCQVDKITGFADLKPGRNVELDPTLTAIRTDSAAVPGGSLNQSTSKVEPGLSARWGITPNVSLNAALNPDFSQVEADIAQLSVNQRFALFYPEKRPFFLEGSDFFSTPISAVFTRTVVDPRGGLKITGKEGKNGFGMFVAEDRQNTFTIPSNQRSDIATVDEEVRSGVVRWRRDLGATSTLGGLYADREADGYHNRVGGLDGFFRFNTTDSMSFQALRSDTLYPDQIAQAYAQRTDAFTGNALYTAYQHAGRDWFWAAYWQDLGTGFRADSGYVPRVDIRDGGGQLQHQWYGTPANWYSQINLGLTGERIEDHSGQLTDELLRFYGTVNGPLQSILQVGLSHNKTFVVANGRAVLHEGLNGVDFDAVVQPSGVARLELSGSAGDTVDYTNNQPATQVTLSPSAELKLGAHVNAKLDHTYQRLNVDGGRLFEANLSQLKLVYNFNVRCFVRGIFQYLDLKQDPALYDPAIRPFIDAKTQTFFTQLLFSYKLNPQTVLFLGYTDNRLGTQDLSLSQTDRTFFFKVGYALVM